MDLKRKVSNKIVQWKANPNRLPLIVDGLRQVGKSYVVSKFANENYEHVVVYDFRHRKKLRKIFDGDIDVDSILTKSSPYFPKGSFVPGSTVLVFEEIGDCPNARASLKSFASDRRFDVIGTGSLLGVLSHRRVKPVDVPTGYETIIEMTSLDFEEFLWANGLTESDISVLRKHTQEEKELPSALASYFKEMIKRYIVVGGMPRAVTTFLSSNNYAEAREYLIGLITDYRGDFGRFIDENGEEQIDYYLQAQLNRLLDSIPVQLGRENMNTKFRYGDVEKGGRASKYERAFDWLSKSGLILRTFNVRAPEMPLTSHKEDSEFKLYLSDIGLLMAMYPIAVSQRLLSEDLDSRKGAIYENLLATMINKVGIPLYYFGNGTDHLEVDFLIESSNGMILLEEKATNGKMAASKAIMTGQTKYRAHKCYKIIQSNFGEGDFFTTVPQYAVPFLLEKVQAEESEGTTLPPLPFPA